MGEAERRAAASIAGAASTLFQQPEGALGRVRTAMQDILLHVMFFFLCVLYSENPSWLTRDSGWNSIDVSVAAFQRG